MEGSAFQNEAVPALKGEAVFQDALRRNTAMKKIGGIALFLNLFQRAACGVFARQLARPAYLLEKKKLSMLMFSVLPKRRGQVMSVISALFSHYSLIKNVFSGTMAMLFC